ncbi:3-oxoacyl-[acyl-carrier-protein] synthase 3 protein 2 [Paenibacillus cisolokensis]|uniref:Beta-ketoacyl-[acyl-carrier-protein] synthase III n=1 Tax=Paenibacillus cisolokensis TaxID=1658519 RepID=A0ABQ4N8G6_9BACL|nr:3-oxoacyl-[acyl-carrier-protein] synthase 3 protein 2 [Paenibacillus cisolokensis]
MNPIHPRLRSNARITAIGSYVPDRILSNFDLERMVDTSDEWIVQRTGIRERRIAAENEYCSDLCIAAVRDMIDRYGVTVQDADYIIVATETPDTSFPNVASRIQAAFGMANCGSVELHAACAGFVAALQMANGLLLSGAYRKIIVIGAETLSKITDYTDRTTCILFGDGAGAVLLEASDQEGCLLGMISRTDGSLGHHLYRSNLSDSIDGHPIRNNGLIVQNGREVYRWAVEQVPLGVNRLLDECGLKTEDIDWFAPHTANARIIESVCGRSGIPLDKTLSAIERFGNTSAASIPLSLDAAVRDGRLKSGDIVLLYGFGGGLIQAGAVVRWTL